MTRLPELDEHVEAAILSPGLEPDWEQAYQEVYRTAITEVDRHAKFLDELHGKIGEERQRALFQRYGETQEALGYLRGILRMAGCGRGNSDHGAEKEAE